MQVLQRQGQQRGAEPLRTLEDLTSTADPAWPLVRQWLAESSVSCEALPASELSRAECLFTLQVTTHSTLGAVAYETGGVLVDHGWLRLLGSGHPRLQRSLATWNAGRTMDGSHRPPPMLLVADDVLGGIFAINGGGLGEDAGHLYYFAPDTLRWEPLSIGYTAFLQWALSADNLAQFYSSLRWPGWQTEIASLTGDQGVLVYPFLVAAGHPSPIVPAVRSRWQSSMAC